MFAIALESVSLRMAYREAKAHKPGGHGVVAVHPHGEVAGVARRAARGHRRRGRIKSALNGSPHVRSLIHTKTQHLGPDDLPVAAKIEFDPTITIDELATSINAAEDALRAAVPTATLVYIAPDVRVRAQQTPT